MIVAFPGSSIFRAFSALKFIRNQPGALPQAFTFRAVGAETSSFSHSYSASSSIEKARRMFPISLTLDHHGREVILLFSAPAEDLYGRTQAFDYHFGLRVT